MKTVKIFAVAFVLVFSSCKKEGIGRITGIVKEYGTNKPIVGAGVRISDNNPFPKRGQDSETTTNANGDFAFVKQNHALFGTWISAVKEGYCIETINLSEKNELFLAPEATLKVHLINSNPSNGKAVSYQSRVYEIASDTTFFEITRGNSYPNKIYWNRYLSKNENDTTVYCVGKDTLSITLKY